VLNDLTTGLIQESDTFFSTLDNYFAVYEVKHNGKTYSLCKACSPYPKRSILFFGKGWRPDRPGENDGFYKVLLADELKEYKRLLISENRSDTELASKAIYISYYNAMLKVSQADIEHLLNEFLPQSWKAISKNIAYDIMTAVTTAKLFPVR